MQEAATLGKSSLPSICSKGRNTENAVPVLPGRTLLMKWMVPSCFSMIPRVTHKPSPVPAFALGGVERREQVLANARRDACAVVEHRHPDSLALLDPTTGSIHKHAGKACRRLACYGSH